MADNHRPLVPVPRGARSLKQNDPQPSPKPKRSNIGSACSACKSRKLKCSGIPPCQNCLKNRIECTVDRNNDKRRKGGIKSKLERLEERKDLLLSLVRTIRDSGDRRTLQLLDLVRSNASLTEIKFYLDDECKDGSRAQSDIERKRSGDSVDAHDNNSHQTCPSGSPSTETKDTFDPQRLADIPLFDVPAAPWTTVVEDAGLVSQLVSLWFTWFHPFSNWLDRDLFIRDMKSGDRRARFCSPFLVNAILAVACTHSNCPRVYAVPGDMESRGAHFYYAAKCHLEAEEGRISLPIVQGLGLLIVYAGISGKDRHGWIYQSQLTFAIHELSQQSRFPRLTGSTDACRPSSMLDHTIWGLFNVATVKTLIWKKQPMIKPPIRHYPPPARHAEHFWCPYPLQLEGIKAHTNCLFQALCDLNRIVYDLGRTFFNGEQQPQRSELEHKTGDLQTRLQDWKAQLPSCVREPEDIQTPHIISLHMYYYSICITLDENAPSIKPDPNAKHDFNHHSSRMAFARRISCLMRIHCSSWGVNRMPIFNIFSTTTALLALLADLSDPRNREAFVHLAVVAKAFARRWVLGQKKLEQVQAQAQWMGIKLPDETEPLFSGLESHTDGPLSSRKRVKLK